MIVVTERKKAAAEDSVPLAMKEKTECSKYRIECHENFIRESNFEVVKKVLLRLIIICYF